MTIEKVRSYNILTMKKYLVIQHSLAPGTSGYTGLPPVAKTTLRAVMVSTFPDLSVKLMVFLLTKEAYLL